MSELAQAVKEADLEAVLDGEERTGEGLWRGIATHRWYLLEKAEQERDEARHAKAQMELRWQAAEKECAALRAQLEARR